MQKIVIYTDGAARGNPGPSGFGAMIAIHDTSSTFRVKELGGYGGDQGTNNQMELRAPIEAFKFLKENKIEGEINIYSDSKYVINGVNSWILNWVKNGWKTANKKPVLNRELWMELHELNQYFKPKWHYVEGHSGHPENDRVDEIATSFADKINIDLKDNF
jgi:ribonuclease HI